jgi:hypothetical protein
LELLRVANSPVSTRPERSKEKVRTFSSHFPCERSHIEAGFDFTVDELVKVRDKAVDERREDGEVVCCL